ncbi:NSS family neurotransmitter:Na+ symporter [Haloactinopolyspora alba]|uniref:Transporter n=1 Tax=Haloactinopolyspora alba TaxID=648780 RepID=A0A2P8DGR2_9ACTN|nr:sodium-dependent transporter [Haloactinopolyspora alba]PSK96391.1 NSS family neurotransmitter:Na+ symporter [Haloactinopolyspora alba]
MQQQQEREQWGSRAGFLFAAIGSAIGLGNIWRFPYVAYDNGGGAFLLPYLVALLTAGIPVLILAYTMGHRFRGSPPLAFRRLHPRAEVIGWWQVGVSFVIAAYYAVIIAWAVRYAGFSVGQDWADDPAGFFSGEFIQAGEPGGITGYVSGVAWPLVAVWVVVIVVLLFGVRRGIQRLNMVFIPLLAVLFGILVVRAVTLDGAELGLDALFSPDWDAITDGGVWVAAYGQIFFSLSVGFGIMITYASHLHRKADLSGSALVAGFANSSFEILAGIGVFAALGFMAASTGVAVGDVAESGVGLAFIAFPQIISTLTGGAGFFGVLFFASLVVAGLTSLISIVQVVVSAVQDRTGMARTPAVLIVGGVLAVLSVGLFSTAQGLPYLDVADHFINSYGVALAALVMVVVVAWVLRQVPALRQHANATSIVHVGLWWQVMLGVVTPVVLGWMMYDSLRQEFEANYGDYTSGFLVIGWGVAVGVIVVAVVLSLIPWRRPDDFVAEELPVAEKGRRS